MPPPLVQYHWVDAFNNVFNPPTFHEYHADAVIPENATLRRILLSQTQFFWIRPSDTYVNQQMYFVHYDVTYGLAEGAPHLYRSTRTMKEQFVWQGIELANAWVGFHSGGDNELGFNEKVQRGGWGTPSQTVRLSWFISSSGAGEEVLPGQANVPFRVLYSVPVPP